jgi:hypothetical protein
MLNDLAIKFPKQAALSDNLNTLVATLLVVDTIEPPIPVAVKGPIRRPTVKVSATPTFHSVLAYMPQQEVPDLQWSLLE